MGTAATPVADRNKREELATGAQALRDDRMPTGDACGGCALLRL